MPACAQFLRCSTRVAAAFGQCARESAARLTPVRGVDTGSKLIQSDVADERQRDPGELSQRIDHLGGIEQDARSSRPAIRLSRAARRIGVHVPVEVGVNCARIISWAPPPHQTTIVGGQGVAIPLGNSFAVPLGSRHSEGTGVRGRPWLRVGRTRIATPTVDSRPGWVSRFRRVRSGPAAVGPGVGRRGVGWRG